MTRPSVSLSRQISVLSVAFGLALFLALGSFGWWAASSIDDRSIARQTRAVHRGLIELMDRIPVEQDSSAIWDDSVVNLRAGNEPWIAENLAEWMSEYFGHDRIYILDPRDRPIRAVAEGVQVETTAYYRDEAAIADRLTRLRAQMAEASAGADDSTAAISGLGIEDLAVTGDGQVAIVSIRPIIPGTDAVTQTPGTEFIHVSMRLIDKSVADEIGQHFEIPGLLFERDAASTADRMASPVMDNQGRILGFFTWMPEEPAYELIRDTLPAMAGGLLIGGTAVYLLLRRLRRTSSQLEVTKAEASFLAFHDPMTKLPNRALFEDRLEQALANMRSGTSQVALHYVDLDNFKRVNDTLGHAAGDDLLRQAATRLSGLVGPVDTVARLGGDEFAIIQFQAADSAAVFTLCQNIVDAFDRPFNLSGHESQSGASVGVAVVVDPALQIEDVMRQADVALYEAKNSGRGRYQTYDGELSALVKERRQLELDLRGAVNGKPGLELVYQPIYHARGGLIAGAEALVRWNHPTLGRMSPALFIGLAEERGLIDQLGIWVLRQACLFAAASTIPWVAVNVSPLQFRDEKFADRVFAILTETGLPPRRLEIEITEGLLLQNSPVTQATLMKLRAGGVRVALDDFGTGYSSISYLRTHGIDKLKIDQSYTAQLGLDAEIDSIVRSIVDLGRAMHMAVTAEGVESEAQRRILNKIGCDQLQGYLLSRPLVAAKMTELLDLQNADQQAPKADRA
jgi:diguanylate cyclase (GGDEF)-like protein